MKKPELLSPAGSLQNMEYAFAYGADAVYAGQPRYSLRVRENEFNHIENLAKGVARAHKLGKQFYIASNISPHNDKVKSYLRDMEQVIAMKPDALIMSDPGIIMMVREKWPDVPVHLSVQANAVNWATVKFWQQQGLTRVILSRELSLDEIAEIKQRVPEMEIEVFVHGALCIAYSGRCLLSGYMTHRDSNQGACTNSCRWKYQTHEAEQTDGGEIVPSQAVETYDPNVQTLSLSESSDVLEKVSPLYLLQEKGRPGEYMPAYEDEHGTYIMNSKDLRAVQHVQRLMDIGVESLKIEGRTKSYYYAARTAQVYRQAINDAAAGHEFNMALMDDLEGMANRGFTEGFYRRHVPDEYQNYETGNSTSTQQLFVADVLEGDLGTNRIKLEAKNKLSTGDQLTLLTPVGNISFTAAQLFNSKNGREIESALGSGYKVELEVPELSKLKLTHEALEKGLIVRNI
ncbi:MULTISPECIES: tRNA 5-hydroxyuridine modification protein YegQ [unclassified Oleiphilus]|jgi:putative protease|uniref:prephenate-dependent tRNA uridine(34) hydroxylase TrhP n=3 Tax=Oleiphilus TaxID=141450 RepID=UPI0007C3E9A5|nr:MULTISPECIES: tRNA 5-hydroxyuridine modification protein YegQ [unclassified Oleiphilus]KZY75159.1 U32 family peptidase [Oleiphilus sp. HI0069]KZZ11516.1 U32 family peptidase [Oleiphilus sp. HI0078]KZZ29563.1 U32 family peptidase [Oleiphilus sp. HI0081]KZY63242.1 U32 family peptidase [Oleiphilus sp. HI0061]KZZ36065.1 U32 family peptidase [Oleiphilus sp. HI0086]